MFAFWWRFAYRSYCVIIIMIILHGLIWKLKDRHGFWLQLLGSADVLCKVCWNSCTYLTSVTNSVLWWPWITESPIDWPTMSSESAACQWLWGLTVKNWHQQLTRFFKEDDTFMGKTRKRVKKKNLSTNVFNFTWRTVKKLWNIFSSQLCFVLKHTNGVTCF